MISVNRIQNREAILSLCVNFYHKVEKNYPQNGIFLHTFLAFSGGGELSEITGKINLYSLRVLA